MTSAHPHDPFSPDEVPLSYLPLERRKPRTGGQVWGVLLGTVVMFVILNGVAGWYLDRYPANRGYWLINAKWRLLRAQESPVSTLFLGDSSCNQSVMADRAPQLAGESALNLCTIGGMAMVDDVLILERYLENVGTPERVVIQHTFDIWQRSVTPVLLAKTPVSPLTWAGDVDLGLTRRQWQELLLVRYVPLYASQQSLQAVLRERVPERTLFVRPYRFSPAGYMTVDYARENAVEIRAGRTAEALAGQPFQVSATNEAMFDRLRDLAEVHDFKLIYVNGPVAEPLATTDAFQTYAAQLDARLQQEADRSDQVYYLPGRQTFPAAVMEDLDHITDPVAGQYTATLFEQLERVTGR